MQGNNEQLNQAKRNQRKGVREVREIRSFEVDIDKGILKINGQDVDTPTIVTLPAHLLTKQIIFAMAILQVPVELRL